VIKREETRGYILADRPSEGDSSTPDVQVRGVTMPGISCSDVISAAHARRLPVVLVEFVLKKFGEVLSSSVRFKLKSRMTPFRAPQNGSM